MARMGYAKNRYLSNGIEEERPIPKEKLLLG